MNILYTHSSIDLEADKSVGKLTLAGLIPARKGRLAVSFFLSFSPYVAIALCVGFSLLKTWFLLTFLTLPLAIALMLSILEFCRAPDATPVRRWWYGPMEKWKDIEDAGISWFMVRWYLARNLFTAFTILIIIAAVLR
jgi:1,4-dihydroxy-2-naphthoate octaprenyltransferase